MTVNKKTFKKIAIQIFFILLAIVIGYFLYQLPKDLEFEQRVILFTFGVAGVFWLTEVVPLFVTSFIIAGILILFGGVSTTDAFAPFFDPIIILFLGGFVLSQAFSKYKVDQFIAQKTLFVLGNKPYIVLFGLMIVTVVLSMFMSNTAATALLLPISLTILDKSNVSKKDKLYKAFPLAIAYAATTGGLGTIIGSPPNALAVKYLEQEGVANISFVEWMAQMLPVVIIMLLVIFITIRLVFKSKVKSLRIDQQDIKLDTKGKIILFVSLITIVLWLTGKTLGLSSYLVALIPIIFFYGFGLLKESDVSNLNWSTLLLFGGGLTLGEAVISSGVNEYIALGMDKFLLGVPVFILFLLIGVLGTIFTIVASNTGAAVVMLPIIIPLATKLNVDPLILVFLTTAGVSLDYVLPIGTPPSAIAYSSGYIKSKEMINVGSFLTIFVWLIPAVIAYFFW
jgi:solute carrier family 13 (sodium-dependent dicarboxylate transporter), member 2/3/5